MIFNSKFNSIVIVQGSFNPFKSGNLETNGTCLRIILFSTISAFLERGEGGIIGVLLSFLLIVRYNSLNENLYIF